MQLSDFFDRAQSFLRDPRFPAAEIDYKMRLQAELRPAMEAYEAADPDAFAHLARALRSPNQNIINWRVIQPFARWCQAHPRQSQRALRSLWHGRGAVESRVRNFASELASGAAMTQPGAQLAVASTLLMGVSAEDHPPVRTGVLKAGFSATGYPTFGRGQDAGHRYAHSLAFFDMLVEQAPNFDLRLQNRLEAQGVTWCVTGGWNNSPPPDLLLGGAGDEAETNRLIDAAAKGGSIPETEREALILSRRGQGRFRSRLVGLWGKCAVTGCGNLSLLRASHLKPWKPSTNAERLDPYNGLLLSPHLDAALDCGLITFADEGKLVLSDILSGPDRKALGLHAGMSLTRVYPQNIRYFRYHRENNFRS